MIQVFLSVKATLKRLKTRWYYKNLYHWNLKVCQEKHLLLLPLLVIVFLRQLRIYRILLADCSVVKNVNIFGVDMSSSVHIDNKKKDILILGIGPTQLSDDTTLTAEAQYSINFSRWNRNFV